MLGLIQPTKDDTRSRLQEGSQPVQSATAIPSMDRPRDRLAALLAKPTDLRDATQRATLVAQMKALEAEERDDTVRKAKQLGLPLEGDLPGGGRFVLIGFDGETPEYQKTENVNAAISTATHLVRATMPFEIRGEGHTLGLWEAGGIPRITHQEFGSPSRVTIRDGTTTVSDHATHVAGTLIAQGVNPQLIGMAPGAKIDARDSAGDDSEMVAVGAAYAREPNRIQISNHSYGLLLGWEGSTLYGSFSDDGNAANDVDTRIGRYESSSVILDALLYQLPYYLPFMSAGNHRNDGPPLEGSSWSHNGTTRTYLAAEHPPGDGVYKNGYDLLDREKVAKNILTLGAVNDAVSAGVRDVEQGTLTAFSSTGPADDGRIKPDLVANGQSLLSTSSSSDTGVATASGTSMSSPNAAGSALLLVDYFEKLFPGQSMRASTLKALLIHTADDLGNPGPDYQYGWGLMNTKAAADLITRQAEISSSPSILEETLTTTNGTHTHTFLWNGSTPVKVTLCWTDPAGTPTNLHDDRTPDLVHDLNLTVSGPEGTTHLPFVMPYVGDWTLNKLSAHAVQGINSVDNVEQVAVASSTQGLYTITVNHRGHLIADQAYSLIIDGSGVPDSLTFTPVSGFFATGEVGGLNAPTSKTYTLTNATSTSMDWTASFDQAWAALSVTSGTLAPGASTTLTISHTAAAGSLPAAYHTGTLFVHNVSTGNVQRRPVVLHRVGYPEITVTQIENETPLVDGSSSLDFGPVLTGATRTLRLKIHNLGHAPLTLETPTLSGLQASEFAVNTPSVSTLTPGSVSYVNVTFTPLTTGVKKATLHLGNNDSDEASFELPLTGIANREESRVQLVRDIDSRPFSHSPGQMVVMDHFIFYVASTIEHGQELWRTDGSAAGTSLVKDLLPGSTSSLPNSLTRVGNRLFFTANTNAQGVELWVSDGTTEGTTVVKDIYSGLTSSTPGNLREMNGLLYFTARTSANGLELWRSDGTEAGTVMVRDIASGSADSSPQNLTNVDGVLYFSAADSINGTELWKSDGTSAGTVLVADLTAGTSHSILANFIAHGPTLYFTATSSGFGHELWKSDGSAMGTMMVKDIHPGAGSSSPAQLVSFRERVFFRATTAEAGAELWCSDGTAEGTRQVFDINPGSLSGNPTDMIEFQNALYFTGSEAEAGSELWRSDGTPEGTQRVKDLAPGFGGANPLNLAVGGTHLFFTALTDVGRELWKTNGTAEGTVIVKDINHGTGSAFSTQPIVHLNGLMLFGATDNFTGNELWRSDGTESGTVSVGDFGTGTAASALVALRDVKGVLYFSATTSTTGGEPWRSRGTPADTRMVLDLQSGSTSSSPQQFTSLGSQILFTANLAATGAELYSLNPESDSVTLIRDIQAGIASSTPSNLTLMADRVFFSANDGSNGTELWQSDGTPNGTTMVRNIHPTNSTGSTPSNLIVLNNQLFFTANDGSTGVELWKSDGTFDGTVRVKDINPGSSSASPSNLTVMNGMLYFATNTSTWGTELWKSDGTSNGTVLVADIRAGSMGSFPANLKAIGNQLFFSANNGLSGSELWCSDGTAVGTYQVADVNPGSTASSPSQLVEMNGQLYFNASHASHGSELWRSDGTSVGTVMVRDIHAGAASGNPLSITPLNGRLYFSATSLETGAELWQSDGSSEGTTLVTDLFPGPASSHPSSLTPSGHILFFVARSPIYSTELFSVDTTPPPEIAIEQPLDTPLMDGASVLTFEPTAVSTLSTLTLRVRNEGGLPLTLSGVTVEGADASSFSVTPPILSQLTEDEHVDFQLHFSPVSSGIKHATLRLISNDADEGSFEIHLTGTGFGDPQIQVEQPAEQSLINGVSSLSFNSVNLGASSSALTVTVRNTAPATILNLGSITVSGDSASDFKVNATGMSHLLAGGASTSFTIQFTPLAGGVRTATLNIVSTDFSDSPFQLHLTGTGVAIAGPTQTIAGPASLPFRLASDGSFTLPFVATSGLRLTIELLAGHELGSLVGDIFTPNGATGSATVRISQMGGAGYDSAATLSRSFQIVRASFVKLAQGHGTAEHGAGIQSDGTLWTWGAGTSGQLGTGFMEDRFSMSQVGTDTDWNEVAVGSEHTLALKKDGSLWAWGNNSLGQLGDGTTTTRSTPHRVGNLRGWVAISAGGTHSLALRQEGSLWAWGNNSHGQLGDGSLTTRLTPMQISASGWAMICAGSLHSLAIKTDGSLWAWGANNQMQLGLGDSSQRSIPTQVSAGTTWKAISAAESSSYGIQSDGSLWGWGFNQSCQLGDGTTLNRSTPNPIGSATWKSVAGGGAHASGIRTDGSLWTWGLAANGQTGQKNSNTFTTPRRVNSALNWTAILAGRQHTVALKNDGTLWTMGSNGQGQLAYPLSQPTRLAPGGIRAVAQGQTRTHFIRADGTLWGMGTNNNDLGDGTSVRRPQAVQIGSDNHWQSLGGGYSHLLALRTDGTLWAAGSNSFGQLGDGTVNSRSTLVPIGSESVWQQVSAGLSFSAGVQSNGSLWTWGNNGLGQLGQGDVNIHRYVPTRVGTSSDWTQVSTGHIHGMALRSDGTLWGWGNNDQGQVGLGNTSSPMIPTQVGHDNQWVQVSSGGSHTLALKSDGSLWAWGLNDKGQLGDGSTINRTAPTRIGEDTDWKAIQAGESHSLALKSKGELWAWGLGSSGQLGNGAASTLLQPTRTVAGQGWTQLGQGITQTSLLMHADGSLWSFGRNLDSQQTDSVRLESSLECAWPPIATQSVTVPPIQIASYGTPVALQGSSSSGLPLSYTVSGPAFIENQQLTVTGPGAVHLMAWQTGLAPVWHPSAPIAVAVQSAPSALTQSAESVDSHRAVVRGQIFAGGQPTQVFFDYDTDITDGYAFSVSATPDVVSDGSAMAVSADLSQLAAGRLHHFRVRAVNASGTAVGEPLTFSTTSPEIGLMFNNAELSSGSSTVAFGSTALHGPLTRSFVLKNIGAGELTALSFRSDSSEWTIQTPQVGPILASRASVSFTLTFTPTTMGSRSGQLIIESNDEDESPFTVALTGLGLQAQALHFPAIPEQSCGTALTLSAQAESGLPVSFTLTQGSERVSWTQSNLLNFIAPGMVTLRAEQAGNDVYAPVAIERSFTVIRGQQTLSFLQSMPNEISSSASFDITALSNRGLDPIAYSIESGPAVLHGSILSPLSLGTVRVRATQSGNAAFHPASITHTFSILAPIQIEPTPRTLTVGRTEPATFETIVTGQGPIRYQWYRDSILIPGATSSSYSIPHADESDDGAGFVMVATNSVSTVSSSMWILRVIGTTPEITEHPAHRLAHLDSDVTLSVTAVGEPPLRYQWRKNGLAIAGATKRELTLPKAQLTAAAAYSVVVSNVGSVTSDLAQLGIVEDPKKTVIQNAGTTASLSLRSAGKDLHHAWFKDGLPLGLSFTNSLSADGRRLTLTQLSAELDSGRYTCLVSAPGVAIEAGTHELRVIDDLPSITLNEGEALPPTIVSADYRFTIPVDNSPRRAPSSYSATGLPTGLKLNASTGEITGRPTVSKPTPYAIKLAAINPRGRATVNVTLHVSPLPSGSIGSFIGHLPRQGLTAGLGGRFDLTTTATGAFSGKVTLGSAAPLSFTGGHLETSLATDSPPQGRITIKRPAPLAALELAFAIDPDRDEIREATLTAGAEVCRFTAWRNVWTAGRQAQAYRGLYNAALLKVAGQPQASSTPDGNGYLSFTIAPLGSLTLSGKTADGESITGSAFVGLEGQVLVHKPLYITLLKGSLSGTCRVNRGADLESAQDNPLTGTLTQSRPANPATAARLYRSGFDAYNLELTGGFYSPPLSGSYWLGFTAPISTSPNARLSFTGGGLAMSSLDPSLSFRLPTTHLPSLPAPGSPLNRGSVTCRIRPATGLVTGSFSLSDTLTTGALIKRSNVAYQALVIPQEGQQIAHGYFLLPQLPNPVTQPPSSTAILSGEVRLLPEEP